MPRVANLDVTAGDLCRENALQIQRDGRILVTFQTDARHVLPWLLGEFGVVVVRRIVLESLRRHVGLRGWEVVEECLPRIFGPQIVALDAWTVNFKSEDLQLPTSNKNHRAGGASSPTDMHEAVMYNNPVTPPALAKSGACKPCKPSGAMSPPAECITTVTS